MTSARSRHRPAVLSVVALVALALSAPPSWAAPTPIPVDAPPQTRVEVTDTAPSREITTVSPGTSDSSATAAPTSTTAVSTTSGPTAAIGASTTVAPTTTVPTKRIIEFVGHGYGHGRGLGQWGAYGYAVDKGWDYRRILAHYYSNTVPGRVSPQSAIGVRLTAMEGKALTVYQERGRITVTVDGQSTPSVPSALTLTALSASSAGPTAVSPSPGSATAVSPSPTAANATVVTPIMPAAPPITGIHDPASVRVVVPAITPSTSSTSSTAPARSGPLVVRVKMLSPGQFSIADAPTCEGPFTERTPIKTSAVFLSPGMPEPSTDADDPSNMLQICTKTGRLAYRGDLVAADGQPGQRTVNQVPLDAYVRSVVPAEVPRSWGSTPKGMEALRAQAVAARSYAAVERRSGYANTCDTTACQVYRGRGEYRATSFTSFEDTRTDQAVSDTANEVRVDPTTGAPVRTEFSSSTGGQTAGGVHPAVVDDGDATPNNPHNKWTFRVPASKLENGRGLGALLVIEATKRDGFGPDGGRVQQVRLLFTKGTVTMSGGELASLLGLRSTLYTATVLVVPVNAFSDDTPTTPEEAAALAADDEPGTAAAYANTASKKKPVKTTTMKSTTTTALITPATPAKKAPTKS